MAGNLIVCSLQETRIDYAISNAVDFQLDSEGALTINGTHATDAVFAEQTDGVLHLQM